MRPPDGRRLVVVVVALALVAPLLFASGAAVAQPENETTTTNPANNTTTTTAPEPEDEWSPPGPFSLEALTTGGTKDADAPTASRSIGTGGVLLRYKPVGPLKDSWQRIEPQGLVEADRLQVFSNAYVDAVGRYTFVIVHWQKDTKSVNGTSMEYAADQEVQRVTLDIEKGYGATWINLNSEFNQTEQVTMWLERDGEPVPGARWRFQHRSNPLTQAPAFPVNSQGDLWRWAGLYIFLPAIPGIFIARHNAHHILERTVVGAQKGTVWWLFIIGVLGLVLAVGMTWQTAAVLARIPIVAGLSFYAISLVAMLGLHDPDIEQAQMTHKNIEATTTVSGEDGKKTTHVHNWLIDIVRRDNNIYAPKAGFRPMFARYFADPAKVAEDQLRTVTTGTGDIAKHYELDPGLDQEEVLVHEPARLRFSPQLFKQEDAVEPVVEWDIPEDAHPAVATAQAIPASVINTIGGVLGAINWRFVAIAAGGGALGYYGVLALVGVQTFAVIAGALPALVGGYQAVDGELRAELAPKHYHDADAVLAIERENYKEAATFDELQSVVADMGMDEHERVQNFVEAFWDKVTERFDSLQGPGSSSRAATKAPGVGDD